MGRGNETNYVSVRFLHSIYRRVRIKRPWEGNLRMQRKRGVGAKCVVRRKWHVQQFSLPLQQQTEPVKPQLVYPLQEIDAEEGDGRLICTLR